MRLLSLQSWYAILSSRSVPSLSLFQTSSLVSSGILPHKSSTISWSTTPSPSTHSRRRWWSCPGPAPAPASDPGPPPASDGTGVRGPIAPGSLPVGVLGSLASSPTLDPPASLAGLPNGCSTCSYWCLPSTPPSPAPAPPAPPSSPRASCESGGKRYAGRSFWNQGSCRISWSLMRLFESTVSMRERSERASDERNGGRVKMPPVFPETLFQFRSHDVRRVVREGLTVDLLEEHRDVVVVERQPPAEHHVEDDSARPDVDLGASVQPVRWPGQLSQQALELGICRRAPRQIHALSADDFGCGIVGRAARRLEKVSVAHDVGQSKVCNLDVQVLVQEEAVLREGSVVGMEESEAGARRGRTFPA